MLEKPAQETERVSSEPTGAARSLASTVLRSGAGSLVVKLLSLTLGFLVVVVLARSLGPDEYGVYTYAYALIAALSIPATFGVPTLVVRETAKAQAKRDWATMLGLWRWSRSLMLRISMPLAVLSAVVAWLVSDRFAPNGLTVFLIALAFLPLNSLGALRSAQLRGLNFTVWGQIPELIIRPGLLALLAGGTYWWLAPRQLTAPDAMWLHAGAAFVAVVLGSIALKVLQPLQATGGTYEAEHKRDWFRAVLPLALVSGMQTINNNLDVLMLGLYYPAAEVGILKVVLQFGMLVVLGLQAINVVVAPQIAKLHSNGDYGGLRRIAALSAGVALLTAVPVTGVFLLFGSQILAFVFGEAYTAGSTALMIIALGQTANAGAGSVGIMLSMTGNERLSARGVAIATVANLVLNLVLIPPYGLNGAAAATAVTLVVWNVLLWRYVRRNVWTR